MKQYFSFLIAALAGVTAGAAPKFDAEQLQSDAAGAVAYAALARDLVPTPNPTPTPAKDNEQKETKVTKEIKQPAFETTGGVADPTTSLPSFPSVDTPAAPIRAQPVTRPTFAPQRAPAIYYSTPYYYAPQYCPSRNCAPPVRCRRW